MKIENKQTDILRFEDGEERHTYATLLMIAINSPVKSGMDIDEMRKRVALMDILDTGVLEFNEEQTVDLRRYWKAHRWVAAHKSVIDLDDAINQS